MAGDGATRAKTRRGRAGEPDTGGEAAERDAGAPEPSQDGVAAVPDTAAPDPGRVIEALKAELAQSNERVLRERADLENVKKRAARERAELVRYGTEPLLRELLPILDNLERALAQARGSSEIAPLAEGIELVLRAMSEVLERHGAKAVEARGGTFDPAVHEAIGHVESELAPNAIIEEHQRGYLLHDRLLRPSLVTVSKGPAEGADVAKAGDDG